MLNKHNCLMDGFSHCWVSYFVLLQFLPVLPSLNNGLLQCSSSLIESFRSTTFGKFFCPALLISLPTKLGHKTSISSFSCGMITCFRGSPNKIQAHLFFVLGREQDEIGECKVFVAKTE